MSYWTKGSFLKKCKPKVLGSTRLYSLNGLILPEIIVQSLLIILFIIDFLFKLDETMRHQSTFTPFFAAILLLTLPCTNRAQTPIHQFSVSSIADSLLDDANSIVRLSSTELTVKDPQNATGHFHEVYTVLNKKADRNLIFASYNSSFRQLTDVNIRVYDKQGLQIQKYNKKDMMSTSFGEELVDDGSLTYFRVSPPSYPVTVEFDYDIKYKGILVYPGFEMQSDAQSVEKSSYQITLPTALGFRYKSINTSIKPRKNTAGLLSTYQWEVANLPAVTLASHAGPDYQYLPMVLMAADQFSMDNYPGKMDSWAHFGDWVRLLNKKDAALKPEQIAFYQQLTAGAATQLQKARLIYDYMQRNMRYVSIQLGIGGYKPLPAAFVSTKKYGDCKALSHFMQAALSAIGIESYPALINADRPDLPVDQDFPNGYFDHEILCIPRLEGVKDTTWLECTSKLIDFGKLGYSTAGNYALLLTPDGGKLIKTPASTCQGNVLSISDLITLHADGSAIQQSRYAGQGAFKDLFLYGFYQHADRDKKDFITDYLGLKSTDSLRFNEQPKNAGPYTFDLDLKYDNFPDFSSGRKVFVRSRPFSRFIYTPDEDSSRKADYYFQFAQTIRDTTIYQLDGDMHPESVPENRQVSYDFGTYASQYHYDADSRKLSIINELVIKQDIVKAAKYNDLIDFTGKVAGDVEEKIVFIKD